MKKFFSIALSLIMLFSFVGCGTRGTDVEEIKKSGKLLVGITECEPMDYKENGEWTGFDAEFARLFAKEKLGVEVEFVEIIWKERYDRLKEYDIDCVWNGLTIDTEQQEAEGVSVSAPYVLNSQVLVMKEDRVADYENGLDVKDLAFAVEEGSAGDLCVQREAYKNVTLVETQDKALELVNDGTADAAIIDITMADAVTGEGKKYSALGKGFSFSIEGYGVAFRKDSDLTDMLNKFIDEIRDDELWALAEKYGLTLA